MCGRYTITNAEASRMAERFGFLDEGLSIEPRFNIAPTQEAPIVIRLDRRLLRMMRWGLVPSWAKDPAIGNRMINARADGLAAKPSFRTPLRRRRCLIPADGFYEWQKLPGQRVKRPVWFSLKDRGLFAFAGLWDSWKEPDGGELETFTIITTGANDLVRPVHERMPAMLLPEHEDRWLEPAQQDASQLLALLVPYPPDCMEAREVSPVVNSPANEGPQCIRPANAGLF